MFQLNHLERLTKESKQGSLAALIVAQKGVLEGAIQSLQRKCFIRNPAE